MSPIKQAVVLWFSGVLAAMVLMFILKGMFLSELQASRWLVERANATLEETNKLLAKQTDNEAKLQSIEERLDKLSHEAIVRLNKELDNTGLLFVKMGIDLRSTLIEQYAATALNIKEMREQLGRIDTWIQTHRSAGP